jgi:hypothetical protein
MVGAAPTITSGFQWRWVKRVTNERVILSTKAHLWLDIPWIFIVKETARG